MCCNSNDKKHSVKIEYRRFANDVIASSIWIFCLIGVTTVSAKETECLGGKTDCSAAEKAEVKRVKQYDKPVQKDRLGNALIDGGVTGIIKGSVSAGVTSAAKSVGKEAAKAMITDNNGSSATPESCWSSWTKRQCSDSDETKMRCGESKRLYEECKISEKADEERKKRDKQNALKLSKP